MIRVALMSVLCAIASFAHADTIDVHANAISTMQLLPEMAKQYSIERSPKSGLLNVSIETATGTVRGSVQAKVGDLTGHFHPVPMRETSENGDVDYLGEFTLDGTGTYVFEITVNVPGHDAPIVSKFSQDLVVD